MRWKATCESKSMANDIIPGEGRKPPSDVSQANIKLFVRTTLSHNNDLPDALANDTRARWAAAPGRGTQIQSNSSWSIV